MGKVEKIYIIPTVKDNINRSNGGGFSYFFIIAYYFIHMLYTTYI